MTDRQRIERLENVLGTLITWLAAELGTHDTACLLRMLLDDLYEPSEPNAQT